MQLKPVYISDEKVIKQTGATNKGKEPVGEKCKVMKLQDTEAVIQKLASLKSEHYKLMSRG